MFLECLKEEEPNKKEHHLKDARILDGLFPKINITKNKSYNEKNP